MQKLFTGFLLICSLALITTFNSCKKDAEATTEQKLAGKWTLQAAYMEYHLFGQTQKDTVTESSGNYIQFNTDGTTTASDGGQTSTGTWKLQDNKLVVTETGDEEYPMAYDIKSITSSQLHLYNKEVDGEDYIEINVHFKK